MPISFVYDIYEPSEIKRQYVKEERAGMTIPVSFEQDARFDYSVEVPEMPPAPSTSGVATGHAPLLETEESEAEEEEDAYELTMGSELTTTIDSEQVDLGERFSYHIENPISIRRGQSALVPLFDTEIECAKEHLYNRDATGEHPLVCMLVKNTLGTILDRGPITVFDTGLYAGEAILPFTTYDAENRVAYATDQAVTCSEKMKESTSYRDFQHDDRYLVVEHYEIETYDYIVENRKTDPVTIIIEHPKNDRYEIFDTPDMLEETENFQRWRFEVPPQTESIFTVKQRHLVTTRQTICDLSAKQLETYYASDRMHDELHAFCRTIIDLNAERTQYQHWRTMLEKQNGILEKEVTRIEGVRSQLIDPSRQKILESRQLKQRLDGADLIAYRGMDYLTPLEKTLYASYQEALVAHHKRIAAREDCIDFINRRTAYLDGKIRLKFEPKWRYAPSAPAPDRTEQIKSLLEEDLVEKLIHPLETKDTLATRMAAAAKGGD